MQKNQSLDIISTKAKAPWLIQGHWRYTKHHVIVFLNNRFYVSEDSHCHYDKVVI